MKKIKFVYIFIFEKSCFAQKIFGDDFFFERQVITIHEVVKGMFFFNLFFYSYLAPCSHRKRSLRPLMTNFDLLTLGHLRRSVNLE